MADTLDNIVLPADVWVDLYDESGITVGVQIDVANQSSQSIKLYSGVTPPADLTVPTAPFKTLSGLGCATNDTNDLGAWAISIGADGLVNVSIA